MPIFLDCADPARIAEYQAMGYVRGVTTNPSMIRDESDVSSWDGFAEHAARIAELVEPYPVSVPVLSNEAETMRSQATELASLRDNVVVKVPGHGPDGETHYLATIHALAKKGIQVNATALFSADQACIAALTGAAYVSLFAGRVPEHGGEPIGELERIRGMIESRRLPTRIIASSTQTSDQFHDWIDAGADFVTLRPVLLEAMMLHEATRASVGRFLLSGRALSGELSRAEVAEAFSRMPQRREGQGR